MPGEYGGGSQSREVSVELAERDPEGYKRALVELLSADTKLTGLAWSTLQREGIFDEKTIVLRPGTWVSETRKRPGSELFTITLGTTPLSTEEKRSLIFHDERVNDKVYLLSHEISHVIAGNVSRRTAKVAKMYAIFKAMRAEGKGLSALGSLDFYKTMGPAEQAKEDVVELVNMHLIDPEYLKSYLAFLSDPKLEAQRSAIGVTDIDADVARYIERIVTDGVKERLGR